jgi:hypothetical protein
MVPWLIRSSSKFGGCYVEWKRLVCFFVAWFMERFVLRYRGWEAAVGQLNIT